MANAVSTNGQDDGGGGVGGMRPPRLPRWTRQEILVLIQGKKVAESRGRGRSRVQQMGSAAAPLVGVGSPVEPKWATVSSYCRRHGVNRGPVQCRKRWSNLAGDFKKIKEWELRRAEGDGGGGGGESFWSMRNDLRRERRLPGFFDRGVYDILDGAVEVGGDNDDSTASATRKEAPSAMAQQQSPAAAAGEDEEEKEAVFDSGRAVAEDGLFSDFEADDEAEDDERPPQPPVAATPISERKSVSHDPSSSDQAAAVASKQQANNLEKPAATAPLEANKRRRTEHEDPQEPALQHRLLDVLESNSRMLSAQLEAQNLNSRLDRDQRRGETNSVVQVLNKVADALGRIADKL